MIDIGISILAGGKSSRMGEDKGLMSLLGKPMIEYVIDQALVLKKDIQIISNNPFYSKFGFKVCRDVFADKGPLAGIYTALINSEHEYNLILSCDIPYAQAELFEYIILRSEGFDATIPMYEDRIHPLIGVYSKEIAPLLKAKINAEQLKIMTALEDLHVNILQIEDFEYMNFKNLNSKSDL